MADKLTVHELAAEIARHTGQPVRRSVHCPGELHAHGDKSPSLHVFASQVDGSGRYKCHLPGCEVNGPSGKGGDSIDWFRYTGQQQQAYQPDPGRIAQNEQRKVHDTTWNELRDRHPDLPEEARAFIEPESLRDRLLRHLHKNDTKIEQRHLSQEQIRSRGLRL